MVLEAIRLGKIDVAQLLPSLGLTMPPPVQQKTATGPKASPSTRQPPQSAPKQADGWTTKIKTAKGPKNKEEKEDVAETPKDTLLP